MRVFIAFILLFITTSLEASTYIRWLNGALNVNYDAMVASQNKFKEVMTSFGWSGEKIIYKPLPNYLYSGLPNILFRQQYLSGKSFNSAKTNPRYGDKSDFYLKLSIEYKNMCRLYDSETDFVLCFTTDAFFKSIKNQLINNDNVIIVAHSQGNLYAEALSAMVFLDEELTALQKNSFKVVSLGSVAYTTNNDRYINVDQDVVVYDKNNWYDGLGSILLSPMPANYSACYLLCIAKTDSVDKLKENLNSKGFSGVMALHTAMSMYLNDDIYLTDLPIKKPISSLPVVNFVVGKVSSSIIEVRKIKRISISNYEVKVGLLEKLFSIFLRSAYAQNSVPSLSVDINSTFYITVESSELSGNEAVSIDGVTCDPTIIQKAQGFFTQKCTAGNGAGSQNKIRVYDTKYDADLTINDNYKYLTIRGPIIAPLAPTLTDLGSGSVRVSWASVSGAGTYEVYRGQTLISTTASTSIDDSGQTAGSEVCYRVRAIANGVASSYSPQQCITPAAPKCANQWTTGYTSAGGTENGTQSCPAGQVGSIALSHTCSSSGVWGATTTKNTCAVVPVSCKGTWTSASYSVGQTETSSQACSTGYSGQTTQSHVCQSNGSWGTTTTNNGCTLAVCNGSWTGLQYSVGQTEEQFTNTCPTGTTGQVRQFHTCLAGGSWSATANTDNCTATLGIPQNLLASVVSNGIQLTWSSVPGATGYLIYRNNDTSGAYYTLSSTSSIYIDNGVVNGQTYTYAVAAQSTLSGTQLISSPSSWVSKTYTSGQTAVATPTGFSVSRLSSGLRLVWNASPGADSYLIYRYDNRSNPFLGATGAVTLFDDTMYSAQGLVSGISYCYRIAAQKGSNTSPMTDYGCAYAP